MNSSQSVADICYQVGFNNLSNFNRQFVDVKALSPSSFRRQHLDKAHARVSAPPSNQKASGIPWSGKGGHRALRFP